MAERKIADISYHNRGINFSAFSKAVDGVIIRCGYGDNIRTQDDKKFNEYMQMAIANGMEIGVYIYSYAKNTSQATSEADHIIRLLEPFKDYRRLSKVLWYDVEEQYQIDIADKLFSTFAGGVKPHGYTAGLYMSEAYYNAAFKNGVGNVPLWIAKYGTNTGKPQTKPTVKGNISLWQYTSTAKIDGIAGNVDMSICYDDTIFSNINRITDFDTAMKLLVDKGAIATPDYWYNAAKVVKYLPELIINMANHMIGE